MFSPSLPALQQLHCLNRSSSGFHDQLSKTLYGEEYQHCLSNLQGDDLLWLVDYLDKVLDGLDPSCPAFRKCLRELRKICGTCGVLPTSYILSTGPLDIGPEPVDSGGFGDVYRGTLNGLPVCIKRVRAYTKHGPERAVKAFCREAVMWKHLAHQNILPFLGVTIAPLLLISAWMFGGNLSEYIETNPDSDPLRPLSDIARGLCYLHSCNVIHGDLKGLNILMDSSGKAQIADFGLAMVTQNLDSMGSASRQNAHTPRWTAPEVLNDGPRTKEADIFSFAMVMIEVFARAVPFSDSTPIAAIRAIMDGRRPPRPAHPAFTENLWMLMQRCWHQDPRLRPEASEASQALLTPGQPAWNQLISDTISADKQIYLITTFFSDPHQVEMIERLSGDDAQNFIDTIDKVLVDLAPEVGSECLRHLYGICGRLALLPSSLAVPLCYEPAGDPLYHGGSADMWKGRYQDREVAAKVLRVYSSDCLEPIRMRFCREVMAWRALRHRNVLPLLGATMTENRLVLVSEWMVNGSINEYVKVDTSADRLGLLEGVTKGLIYMHDQGRIHGDLKGANILIDKHGCPLLAGFTPPMIGSDQSGATSSTTEGGTIPWMSPERLDPYRFGLQECHPTKESDCYALGMVVYEVLSGRVPFVPHRGPIVISKVLGGERPERPLEEEGVRFTDTIWKTLEDCWKPRPSDRPSLDIVLRCLQGAQTGSGDQSDDSGSSATRGKSRLPVPPRRGGSKGGWIGRLTRNAWKILNAIIARSGPQAS